MAKAGFELQFRPYTRRDPVYGTRKTYIRKARSVQTSPVLLKFKSCIRSAMTGKTFRGGTAKENASSVRRALAAAAKGCS